VLNFSAAPAQARSASTRSSTRPKAQHGTVSVCAGLLCRGASSRCTATGAELRRPRPAHARSASTRNSTRPKAQHGIVSVCAGLLCRGASRGCCDRC